jgi:acetylornithine deacetylase/succinyl-diaminopimelate desuccinylase-like protein
LRSLPAARGKGLGCAANTALQHESARGGDADAPALEQKLFREIYRELVEINTTDSVGDSMRAAEAMANRLRAAGLPSGDVRVLSSAPRKGNLVARLRGTGARRPLLLIAHLDVVEAKREDWDFDPFTLQEVDGFFRSLKTALAGVLKKAD